ncbi:MAG: tRNA preQ1(34) S-adenosylmethionine ribosyltransferase-isomerase QueA [Defluviitaleaceae bacterium]|nr:tRNA preQ1(34) S-adenosylmethionine ribosyltransferase-isomerase QueA [Defluviitaleaceae bacterium]
MNLKDFSFDLPEELIAQTPLADRSASRLLTLNRKTGEIGHGIFRDIGERLRPGDLLLINNTKVMPARLFGEDARGRVVEILLLERRELDLWEILVKPGKWANEGDILNFGGKLSGEIIRIIQDGVRVIKFTYAGVFEEILDELGEMPLPPYITEKLDDPNRYQTVYAKEPGSAAAPTAGLHFTDALLSELANSGITIAQCTLHVGLGTFRPVRVENIEEHEMHSEFYIMPDETVAQINAAKDRGGRVICVGTTSMRTLESCADDTGQIRAQSGYTDIFIYPGYTFKAADGLITNFHLPESTLIMLVSAFSTRDHILAAYHAAIAERYRFFSFGDAMLMI